MNLLKWNLNGLKAFKCFHSTRHAPCLWSISVEEMIMSRPIVLPFCKGHKLLFSTSPAYKQFWLSRTSVCYHSDIKRRYLESCEEIGGDKCIRKKKRYKKSICVSIVIMQILQQIYPEMKACQLVFMSIISLCLTLACVDCIIQTD